MVSRMANKYFIVCDVCGGNSKAFTGEQEARLDRSNLGWMIIPRLKDEWDICPGCQDNTKRAK